MKRTVSKRLKLHVGGSENPQGIAKLLSQWTHRKETDPIRFHQHKFNINVSDIGSVEVELLVEIKAESSQSDITLMEKADAHILLIDGPMHSTRSKSFAFMRFDFVTAYTKSTNQPTRVCVLTLMTEDGKSVSETNKDRSVLRGHHALVNIDNQNNAMDLLVTTIKSHFQDPNTPVFWPYALSQSAEFTKLQLLNNLKRFLQKMCADLEAETPTLYYSKSDKAQKIRAALANYINLFPVNAYSNRQPYAPFVLR